MRLINVLIGIAAPYNCLACGSGNRLLCAACVDKLATVPQRCYHCHQPSPDWLTCKSCRRDSRLTSVRPGTVYGGAAKALIWKLKLAGARAAAGIMAERLAPLIEQKPDTIIVPVPTATRRARQRGYDQARLLARELARRTRLPYHDCLARHGQTHQHGLSRSERQTQLSAAFRATRPHRVRGADIILVDDVITTGATLEAAAAVLKTAGAAKASAVAFACADPRLTQTESFSQSP